MQLTDITIMLLVQRKEKVEKVPETPFKKISILDMSCFRRNCINFKKSPQHICDYLCLLVNSADFIHEDASMSICPSA